MANIKKTMAKKRGVKAEGEASHPEVAIAKKPRVALEGPSTSARASSTH